MPHDDPRCVVHGRVPRAEARDGDRAEGGPRHVRLGEAQTPDRVLALGAKRKGEAHTALPRNSIKVRTLMNCYNNNIELGFV